MPPADNLFACDAVVFDLDGTLIDSTDTYVEILNVAFERLELPLFSKEDILDLLIEGVFDWDRILPPDLRGRKGEIVDRSMKIIREIYPRKFREEVKLFPGAARLLREIWVGGLKLALVTSTEGKNLAPKLQPLKASGIRDLLQVIVTADQVSRRKPAPDPLIECARRLSVEPSRMVYVGDSRMDIRAGRAAGTKTVAVLTGVDDYASLRAERPDAIFESVVGLRRVLPL